MGGGKAANKKRPAGTLAPRTHRASCVDMLRRLFVLLPGVRAVHDEFIADMRSAPPGTVGYLFDVGANDGAWTRQWARLCVEMKSAGKMVELHTFEVQTQFFQPLTDLAKDLTDWGCRAHFHAAAAWREEGTVEVLVGLAKGKPRAQNVRVAELDGSDSEKVTIRSIDLAAHINKLLPPSGSVSLMKFE